MTSKQDGIYKDRDGFSKFIQAELERHESNIHDFARNADYRQESVWQVIQGTVGSPRIRRDLSLYLGYKNWADMADAYLGNERSSV